MKVSLRELKREDNFIKKHISAKIEMNFCRVCGNVMRTTREVLNGWHAKCGEYIDMT